MEEKKTTIPHTIEIQKRRAGKITGVKDVETFSEEEILLLTEEGRLRIKGDKLHIRSLNLEEGILTMDGRTDSFVYLSAGEKAHGESLLKRMFR